MQNFFLYARKSTDEEDRQALSIESQLTELAEFAKKESLTIIEQFVESRTAKIPGRPIFNQMVAKLQKGEAQGILAWHPDRLARNSVDGGQLIYLLDMNQLQALKFPTFWFDNTPQGKFMLSIAFGQSKYYVDNLRENILRGIRQKLRRGEFPGKPPLGYLNEPKLRTIVLDPQKAPLVKKLFEIYATGEYSLYALRDLMESWKLRFYADKSFAVSRIPALLSNPFYIALMRVKGKLFEASHPPIVSKELFDKVQSVLRRRGKPRHKLKAPFAFINLLRCGECGYAITAERQKGHHYYRCTKKSRNCSQPYLREEALAQQLRAILQEIAPPLEWRDPMTKQLDAWQNQEAQDFESTKHALEVRLAEAAGKLDRLLDAHLDGVVTRGEYIARKEKFLTDKLDTEAELAQLAAQGSVWLEPARAFLNAAFDAGAAAGDENFLKISNFFKTAGSNLRLKNKKIIFELKKPWDILSKKINPALLFSEKIATINLQSDALILFSILSDFERFSGWWSRGDLNP